MEECENFLQIPGMGRCEEYLTECDACVRQDKNMNCKIDNRKGKYCEWTVIADIGK